LDTQKKAKEIYRFIILIPHRDLLKPLEEYRRRLFAIGIHGAYSFPVAVPFASVSRSFNRDELKELTRNIRGLTTETDGKIQSAGTALVHCSHSHFSFLGVRLGFSIKESLFPQTAKKKILHTLSSPVLCAALVKGENQVFEEAPVLSFRAASLANLAIRPLPTGDPDYSFEWKISPPVWLPKYKEE
jgi:hypothetical protein